MPRIPRKVIDDETTVYHEIYRTALDSFPLGDIEKDFMLDLIRRHSKMNWIFTQFHPETGDSNFPNKPVNSVCPTESFHPIPSGSNIKTYE